MPEDPLRLFDSSSISEKVALGGNQTTNRDKEGKHDCTIEIMARRDIVTLLAKTCGFNAVAAVLSYKSHCTLSYVIREASLFWMS
jgi:hypothetical protein